MEKERIKQDDPNASDLSKSMTEAWKNLSEERRRPYYKLYMKMIELDINGNGRI